MKANILTTFIRQQTILESIIRHTTQITTILTRHALTWMILTIFLQVGSIHPLEMLPTDLVVGSLTHYSILVLGKEELDEDSAGF